jgi:EAL domain-containing protein (putative c-di-GMP-specific phosphodiesterase class I)/GGDEF domain-containing protein
MKRLLILDDDPLTGQTIGNIASLAGYEVENTANHKDFFRVLETFAPDVIALDLVMPEMDGVEVIAELARRHSNAKLIITSGVGGRIMDAAGRTAAERGLDIVGMLPKPFSPASLRELLARGTPADTQQKSDSQLLDSLVAEKNKRLTPRELEAALRKHELRVCYQPKVSCKTGILSGFEALARWTHPVRGVITPDEFIPLAEANDLIDALTLEVMTQALTWFHGFCANIREMQPNLSVPDPSKLSLSINISALSLSNSDIFDRLTHMCQEYDVEPQSLIFELTETSAMEDPVTSLEVLTRLRLRGFRLSIDDFGTGYSSMVQLVKLPFSEIKVDKSFVITAHESEESRVVIKSIVGLGASLGLIITAEGIEDEDTLNFLRTIGCTLAQGYFIARPLEGAEVLPWLAGRQSDVEQRRLKALETLGILDTPTEERFDALIRLAKRVLKMPMTAFSLVDSNRLWFKARSGVTPPAVLRAGSFCATTIESNTINVISDTFADIRFADNPLVKNAPYIRFYAGYPVHAAEGSIIGTFIMLDTKPRTMSEDELQVLRQLGQLVERELYTNALDDIDEVSRVYNHQATELKVPAILGMCGTLLLPCTLRVFELLDVAHGPGNEAGRKSHYVLAEFARILLDCYPDADFIGRFDRDNFVTLQIEPDDKEDKLARWKLESAVRSYNRNALPGLEINYRIGTAHTLPARDYNFQSLLDQADSMMPPSETNTEE